MNPINQKQQAMMERVKSVKEPKADTQPDDFDVVNNLVADAYASYNDNPKADLKAIMLDLAAKIKQAAATVTANDDGDMA